MKAVKHLTAVDLSSRVSEMRANIVEMMLRNMIMMEIPPYAMYPRERHSKPSGGVKTKMTAAATVIPHWRTRAIIAAVKIEVNAPRGNTIFFSEGRVGMAAEADLLFC